MTRWSGVILGLMVLGLSCTQPPVQEKYQKSRDKVVDVKDKVVEIGTGDVLVGNNNLLYVLGDYLIVVEYSWTAIDKIVHLFDRFTYKPVLSTVNKGQGPGEIANPGVLIMNERKGCFYFPDNARMKLYTYVLDSLLADPDYIPEVKCSFPEDRVPSDVVYVSDTLCIGGTVVSIGTNDFKTAVGCWNMQTGKVRLMPYEHPEIRKKRADCIVSTEHGIYVDVYSRDDLLTICDLDGNLKYNVYGPEWRHGEWNDVYRHIDGVFCGDKIVTAYSGKHRQKKDGFTASLLLVFDLEGNYLKTLDVGRPVVRLCYDDHNKRLLLSMNDEMQFGYLPLDELLR